MQSIFRPKLFSILKNGIDRKQLPADVLSGIVVGILALPLAIAFAVASGVSPDKGLITAIVAGFLISLLGGSRVQIGGPTGAFIVIVYGIVEMYGIDGLIISTIMAGIILVMFGLLKLGSLLKFFPQPLIIGFTSGIALVIFSTQIKDAFGLDIDKLPTGFVDKWAIYFSNIHAINTLTAILTLATILITIYFKKITTRVPGSFVAIFLVTIAVQLFQLPVTTIETFFGEIPRSIGITIPHVDWSQIGHYLAPALTIALLGGIESLLSAVVADGMISGNHRSNTELIAQGIANIVTPFFGGIPATGAIARTATNVKNGGRTPIAGIVHAFTLLLIMLFLGKWAKLIPMSALAGVLIVVAYNMSEWRSFAAVLRGSVFDIIILLTTFFLTVLVDLTVAIEVGVVLASLLFMKRMADITQKDVMADVDKEVLDDYSKLPEGIGIYEISGPFFFGSAKYYSGTIKSMGLQRKVLILRMRHVPFMDVTGINNLKEAVKMLKNAGTIVVLSGVRAEVRKELDKHRLTFLIGKSNIYETYDRALEHAKVLNQKV